MYAMILWIVSLMGGTRRPAAPKRQEANDQETIETLFIAEMGLQQFR